MSVQTSILSNSVTSLPGVGPKRAQQIRKLGLETIGDVLYSFPRDYKDFSKISKPEEAKEGVEQLFCGPLLHLNERLISQGRRLIQARLGEYLTLTWFVHHRGHGPSFLYRRLQKAKTVWVYGLVKGGLFGAELSSPEVFFRSPQRLGLMPVYPLMAGISNDQRVSWAQAALKMAGQEISEFLPSEIRGNYLIRRVALEQIHFPTDWEQKNRARERLVFEEFFLFHLGLQKGRKLREGVAHTSDGKLASSYLKHLPFELTEGQKKALQDVARDMESARPMHRLIQGEVGSGKTIVAEYAAVKAVESGGQVAMMVPTEVLARQMVDRLRVALNPLAIRVELLIGNMGTKEQNRVREDLVSGEAQVVVGTHALITDKVNFKNLTLAIVDEQHRFGVRQRLALLGKGKADLLVMSATPIPRSLALTIYGDLETTEIRDLPKGRQAVDTRLVAPARRDDVYRYLLSRVNQGEQAYVIFPLVEESEHVDLKAAEQELDELQRGLLAEARVGLIHGQMGKEKEKVFEAFYRHEIDVLLATTVVEVGMNVPNATVIVIENAERFGLAQLHQLRGRVGRGNKGGICFLLAYNTSEHSRERLDVVRKSNDGFFIAEEDLRLRGPGDLLGVRQSGQPLFRIADLVSDRDILEKSARLAQEVLLKDPDLCGYPDLKKEIERQQW